MKSSSSSSSPVRAAAATTTTTKITSYEIGPVPIIHMDLLKKITEEKNPTSILQETVDMVLLNNLCTNLSQWNLADGKQEKTFNYMCKCFTTGTSFSFRHKHIHGFIHNQ